MRTRQEIVEFMDSKAQSNACPFCGKNDWLIIEDEDGVAVLFHPQLKPEGVQPGRGVPVYLATCAHCAFVRGMNRNTVDLALQVTAADGDS